MNSLDCHSLANHLIMLKARISIVHKETGLSPTYLRRIFTEIHREAPHCGPLKSSPNSLFKNYNLLKQATLYVLFYAAESRLDISTWSIIHAFRRYEAYCQGLRERDRYLDFSSAYQLARWVDADLIHLTKCHHCRSAKLSVQDRSQNVCGVCKQS